MVSKTLEQAARHDQFKYSGSLMSKHLFKNPIFQHSRFPRARLPANPLSMTTHGHLENRF